MHVPALQHVGGGRDGAGERLPLTRCHLDDVALQQPHGSVELSVEGAQGQRTIGRLAREREERGHVEGAGSAQTVCRGTQTVRVEVAVAVLERPGGIHGTSRPRMPLRDRTTEQGPEP